VSLESLIARRYLFGKKKPFMATLLVAVGVGGVTVAVCALILIQAVMAGFSEDLRTKILRFSSPVTLSPVDPTLFSGKTPPPLPRDPRIQDVLPFIETEIIIHTNDEATQGAKLKGVGLDDPRFFSRLNIEFVEGFGVEDLNPKEGELPGILLGSELAKRLNILPILTEEIELVYPFGEVDPTGELRPKTRRFKVIGTFKSGYYDYDNKFTVAGLSEVRRLVPVREVPTQWAVSLNKFFEAEPVAKRLQENLQGSFRAETWGERNRKLFAALRLERIVMFLILAVMIAIATFNIFSLILMMAVDKAKEVAVLRSLGLERKRAGRIFLKIGLVLGAMGTFFGSLLGLGGIFYLQHYPIRIPTPYYLESLPVKEEPLSILLVVILTPLLVLLASWYPARKGERFDIVESLRYE
jgi:lipoprotein-releasing system permease protein